MENLLNELILAIEEGDLQLVNQLIERVLTNSMPDEQYGIAELLMQYGFYAFYPVHMLILYLIKFFA